MLSRLRLDHEMKSFVYEDPETNQIHVCDGVIQCQIYVKPDQNLSFVPFLPIRQGAKSYRALCPLCLKQKSRTICNHNIQQRTWRGTYSMSEIAYACTELGAYVLVMVEESLCYPLQSYLFRDYMALLAAKKLMHQTPPKEFRDSLADYCADLNQSLHLTHPLELIKPESIQPNAALAAFYKGRLSLPAFIMIAHIPILICLAVMNVSIGKLSQHKNQSVCEFVDSQQRLTELVCDPKLDLQQVFLVRPDIMQCTYKQKDEFVKTNLNTQMILNGLITSKARITLDRHLRSVIKVNATPLYCDTDSLVYLIDKKVNQELPFSPVKLGFFKSEVPSGQYLRKFQSLSPKNYSMDFADCNTHQLVSRVVKVRGLTLRGPACKAALNADHMEKMIQALRKGQHSSLKIPQRQLRIDGKIKKLKWHHLQKKYSTFVTEDKRFFEPSKSHCVTWPYGLTSFERADRL